MQLDNSSEVNYQFLSAKVSELEAEICTLKAENTKLKKDIQGLKGNLKLTKRTLDDKLNTSIAELQSNRKMTNRFSRRTKIFSFFLMSSKPQTAFPHFKRTQSPPAIIHLTMLHFLIRPLYCTTTNKLRLCPIRAIHLCYHLNILNLATFKFMTLLHPMSKNQLWTPEKMTLSSSLIQMENLSTQRNWLVTSKYGKYFVLLSQLQQRYLPNQLLTAQAILSFTSVQTISNNLPLTLALLDFKHWWISHLKNTHPPKY